MQVIESQQILDPKPKAKMPFASSKSTSFSVSRLVRRAFCSEQKQGTNYGKLGHSGLRSAHHEIFQWLCSSPC